jgi:anti-anti-sigma factor
MRLEAFRISPFAIRVANSESVEWNLLGRLSSLVVVACDCGVRTVEYEAPANLHHSLAKALRRLTARNGIIRIIDGGSAEPIEEDLGYYVLGRDAGFIFLRDVDNEYKYQIFMTAIGANVDLASRCAYLLTNILGFNSLVSFEVRFSIYELLGNIVEHSGSDGYQQWISVTIEKKGDKLAVSIVDKGIEFDPTVEDQFDLDRYLRSGRWRGLGLILTRKIAEQMQYSRESNFNKLFFEKSMSHLCEDNDLNKEGEMEHFIVSDPELTDDGSHLITLEGDLDTKGALVMEDLMFQLMEQKLFNITLDFTNVPFVSSAGVGILLGLVSTFREEGGNVNFRNISPKVRSVFRLLNLDDFFTILENQSTVVDL